MSDPYKPYNWSFQTIANKDAHDQPVSQCTRHNIPTIVHVYNSAVARCQSFLRDFETWVTRSISYNGKRIQYAEMDYTAETSFMFKFAPNQSPITVLMVGPGWARPVAGAEIGEIERLVGKMMNEHRRLADR